VGGSLVKFETAHQAIGRNIRRPGREWQPADQIRVVPVEDALSGDWEVQLPAAWIGEISSAHLRAVMARFSDILGEPMAPAWIMLLVEVLLAPMGIHGADLKQIQYEARLAQLTPPEAIVRNKPVRRKAKRRK